MFSKWRDWVGHSSRRADLVAIFIFLNVFFLINSNLGPLQRDLLTFGVLAASFLLLQIAIYKFSGRKPVVKNMLYSVACALVLALFISS